MVTVGGKAKHTREHKDQLNITVLSKSRSYPAFRECWVIFHTLFYVHKKPRFTSEVMLHYFHFEKIIRLERQRQIQR